MLKRLMLLAMMATAAAVLAIGTCTYRYFGRTPLLPDVTGVPLEIDRYPRSGLPEFFKLPPHSQAATAFDEVMRHGEGRWTTIFIERIGEINVHGPEWSFTVAFDPQNFGEGYRYGTILLEGQAQGDSSGKLTGWVAPMAEGDYERIRRAFEQAKQEQSATQPATRRSKSALPAYH